MIAKITRGSNPGNIGAYLHGPGRANEHAYEIGGTRYAGGVAIGGNLYVGRDASEKTWVKEMRAAMRTRPEITKPIWQASLRNSANDRRLSDAQWADAGQSFAEQMGFAEHPWVMVRHGDDHVHLVVCRVNDVGEVWHGRNDRRAAQSACVSLERAYGLETAPRRREHQRKRTVGVQRELYRDQAQKIAVDRAEIAEAREHIQQMRALYGDPREAVRGRSGGTSSTYQQRRRRVQGQRDPGVERGL